MKLPIKTKLKKKKKFRAMAVCISLMMGRFGSVVGANIVGLLLDNNCELMFTISGTSLICE